MKKILEIMSQEPDHWFSISELTELRHCPKSNVYKKIDKLYLRNRIERKYEVHKKSGVSMQMYRISPNHLIMEGRAKRVWFCTVTVELCSYMKCELELENGQRVPNLTQKNVIEKIDFDFCRQRTQKKQLNEYRYVVDRVPWLISEKQEDEE